jgi:hypothetical protein
VELGGQALERWPRELFVTVARATQALDHFLEHGTQDRTLEWIRIDRTHRSAAFRARPPGLDDLLAADGRAMAQELIKRVSRLQVAE